MHNLESEPIEETEQEYRAIEHALLETARGRWFLAEHSRRSRRMETGALEEALGKLKSSLREPPALLGRVRSDLEAAIADIATTREQLLQRSLTDQGRANTSAILRAAEDLHEQVWELQARDVDGDVCASVGRSAASILALSAAQARESDRAQRFAAALDALSDRLTVALSTITLEASDAAQAPPSISQPPLPKLAIAASR